MSRMTGYDPQQGQEFFHFGIASRPALGLIQLSIQWYQELSYWW